MSIEKKFKRENRNRENFFFLRTFVWGPLPHRGKHFTRVDALALYLNIKNCSPQHLNNVRNSFFPFRTEKSSFISLSFTISFFTENVILEL